MNKIKIIILLIITTITLTGCSYTELNKLAIVSALGIDYKNGQYELTAQVMDIKKQDTGTKEKSIIYETKGETIGKAIRNLSEKYPKTVYLGHVEIIILGKETAEEKINDIFDYVMRSPEVRSTGYVLINREQSAKLTLEPENEKEESFATEQIKSSLESATKRSGTVYLITFEEFLQTYLKKGVDPVVPLIKIDKKNGNETSDTVITNLAVIKDGKIKKSLNEQQSIAYNTINNNYYDIVITPKYKGKTFGAVIFNPNSKIETKIKSNNISVIIDIKVEAKLNELNKDINPNNDKTNKELESLIETELKEYVISLINYSKETNTDVLGIKNNIYKNYPKEYKKYKHSNLYNISNIKINIDANIYRSGNTNKGAIR